MLDIYQAYNKYRDLTNSPANKNTRIRFLEFLGIPVADRRPITVFTVFCDLPIPPEAQKKIDWLTGPNAEALFKVCLLRNKL